MDSDFSVGFKQGQEHGKEIIVEKVKDAITEIEALNGSISFNIGELKAKYTNIGQSDGLEQAIEILKKHLGEELVDHE